MDERDEKRLGIQDEQGEVLAERDRVAEIASELKRRAQPDYLRNQAKSVVIRKTTDMKNRAVRSPIALGIAGALLGTVAARMIRNATAASRREKIEWEPVEGVSEEPQVASGMKDKAVALKDKAVESASHLKDKAAHALDEAKHTVGEKITHVKEKLPSGEEIKGSAQSAYRFATDEQPVIGALLALGAGLALGFLLPVTAKEEELLASAKAQVAENVGQLEVKVQEMVEGLEDKIAGEDQTTDPFRPSPSVH